MHAICMLASKGVVCKFKVLVVQFEKKSAGSSNRCSFGVRGYLNSSPQVLCTICIDGPCIVVTTTIYMTTQHTVSSSRHLVSSCWGVCSDKYL